MSLNTYTRKLGFVGLTTMTSVFISCKAKTTSSKTAAGSNIQGGSCTQQQLTTYKSNLSSLQTQYNALKPSLGQTTKPTLKNCDTAGTESYNLCMKSPYHEQWVQQKAAYNSSWYGVKDPGIDPCNNANLQGYQMCTDDNNKLLQAASNSADAADDNAMKLTAAIQNAAIAVKNCEQQIASQQAQQQAQQTPVISSDTVNDPSNDMNTLSKVQRCTQQYGSLAGVPEGDSCKCYMDTSKQQWRFDAESVCRNYGACTASQYMGVDGKCYSNSILPSTAPSSCPAGQTLLPTKVCGDYNNYVADYQSCQAQDAVLYTDGKCHKSDGTTSSP